MERYVAFCGNTYNKGGGMEDYIGHFSDLEKAKGVISLRDDADWAHVLDHQTGEIHKRCRNGNWITDPLKNWVTK